MAATKDHWPNSRGFDRSYGFLGGETNQWYPDLFRDNQSIDQPYPPEEGYHLSVDLVDQAIGMIADGKQVAPDKPFFLYLTSGALLKISLAVKLLNHTDDFARTICWNRLYKKMDVIFVCSNFDKLNLITVCNFQANVPQYFVNLFI